MYKITCFGSSRGHEGDEQSPARIRAQLRKMEQRREAHYRGNSELRV